MPGSRRKRFADENNRDRVILHKLPTEIISEIFLIGYRSLNMDVEEDIYLATLTSVCRLWRGVAHSTAFLWTHIVWNYEPLARSPQSMNARILRLSAYVKRSNTVLFTLRLDVARETERVCLRIWKRIVPHLERCQSLWLRVLGNKHLHHFVPLPGRLERLTSVDMRVISGKHEIPLFDQMNASQLSELLIHPTLSMTPGSMAHIRTDGLVRVHLQAHAGSLRIALDFLILCHALTELDLNIKAIVFPNDLKPVILPRLKTLRVTDIERFEFRDYIIAQNLEELTVDRGDWLGGRVMERPGFISYSLRALTVKNLGWNALGDFLTIGRSNPTIITLNINQWFRASSIVEALIVSATQPSEYPLFPRLQSLTLDSCFSDAVMGGFYARLLTSCPGVSFVVDSFSVQADSVQHLIRQFGERFRVRNEVPASPRRLNALRNA